MSNDVVDVFMKSRGAAMSMESILTKAIYRVLNQTNHVPDTFNAVEKQRAVVLSDSSQVQMRLVAEQLCRRVERKYERRLTDQRDKEREEMERRLAELKEEYREELEMKSREFERERKRLEGELRIRERGHAHQMELRIADKENQLEVSRKLLEARLREAEFQKDQLDRMTEEAKSRMEADLEHIALEKQMLASRMKEMKSSRRDGYSWEVERQKAMERISELEENMKELGRKLAEAGTQNYALRDQLVNRDAVQSELDSTTTALFNARSELMKLKEELKRRRDYDEVIDENRRLKEDLERLRNDTGRGREAEIRRKEVEWKTSEDSYQLKIKELKMMASMMNEKLKTAVSEKNYLKDELKAVRKELYRDTRNRRGHEKSAKSSALRHHAVDDSSSDDASASTSVSERSSEIQKIKKRISNLDEIARELDASVDHYNAFRKNLDKTDWAAAKSVDVDHEDNYDDFCRSLNRTMRNTIDHEHSKEMRSEDDKRRREVRRRVESAEDEETPRATEKRAEKKEISAAATRETPVLPPQASRATLTATPVYHQAPEASTKKSEMPPPSPITSTPAAQKTTMTPEEQFAERLRLRNAARSTGSAAPTVIEREVTTRPSETVVEKEKPATTEANPLFEGVDPVMAQYMALVMKNREAKKSEAEPN